MTAPTTTDGAVMTDDTIDTVSKALRRAWQLGQTYWQQADSDSYKQQDKSDETQKKFEALVDETRAMLAASPAAPAQSGEAIYQVRTLRAGSSAWIDSDKATAEHLRDNGAHEMRILYTAPQSSQPVEAGEPLTDEQMLDAIKSACNFDGAGVERWRTEALIVGRAVERALLAKPSAEVLDDERAADIPRLFIYMHCERGSYTVINDWERERGWEDMNPRWQFVCEARAASPQAKE